VAGLDWHDSSGAFLPQPLQFHSNSTYLGAEYLSPQGVPFTQNLQYTRRQTVSNSLLPNTTVGSAQVRQHTRRTRRRLSFPPTQSLVGATTSQYDFILKVLGLNILRNRTNWEVIGANLDWRKLSPVFIHLESALGVSLLHGPGNPDPNIKIDLKKQDVANDIINWNIKYLVWKLRRLYSS
jgi:hypothetical protein